LAQLPKQERIDKLQQTFKGVEDDYLRLLRIGTNGANGDGWETDQDDEDEDRDDEVEENGEEEEISDRPKKRVRFG
jgi:hypothetical protein